MVLAEKTRLKWRSRGTRKSGAPPNFSLGVTPICYAESYMTKSTITYWNALSPENRGRWAPINGMEGMAEELTLSVDGVTGEYTRLPRFLPGANTTAFGGKTHPYPEEVCSGQVISDTTIGFFAALFRSKTEGDRLPNTECMRLQL